MTFSQEAGLILIGAGIGLITSLAMAIVQYILGMRHVEKTLKAQRLLLERQLDFQKELEEWKLAQEKENRRELLNEKEMEERRRDMQLLLADADPREVLERMQAYQDSRIYEPRVSSYSGRDY